MAEASATLKLRGPDIPQDEVTLSPDGLSVGRVPGNDLVLPDSRVSRQHLRFLWEGGGFWVEDLESSNGTYIGDERLEPYARRPLKEGMSIRLGPYVLAVESIAAAEPDEPGTGGAAKPPGKPQPREIVRPAAPPEAASQAPPADEGPRHPLAEALRDYGKRDITPPPPTNGDGRRPPAEHPFGIPRDRSTWLKYLPAIYAEDDFTGRFLLIFESLLSPVGWGLDNFTMYLSASTAPREWLHWFASWFDLAVLPDLPEERLRMILQEAGWLFLRRGTKPAVERLLELYFDSKPEIVENDGGRACHFTVRLSVEQEDKERVRRLAERLIDSQKPAFTDYTLEIE